MSRAVFPDPILTDLTRAAQERPKARKIGMPDDETMGGRRQAARDGVMTSGFLKTDIIRMMACLCRKHDANPATFSKWNSLTGTDGPSNAGGCLSPSGIGSGRLESSRRSPRDSPSSFGNKRLRGDGRTRMILRRPAKAWDAPGADGIAADRKMILCRLCRMSPRETLLYAGAS